jgi:hypothetical protein
MPGPRREAALYSIAMPIETNRGRAETRHIGPTRVTFMTAACFEPGDALRFSMSLRGTAARALDVFCSGCVDRVLAEGALFVVEASIETTQISMGSETDHEQN